MTAYVIVWVLGSLATQLALMFLSHEMFGGRILTMPIRRRVRPLRHGYRAS